MWRSSRDEKLWACVNQPSSSYHITHTPTTEQASCVEERGSDVHNDDGWLAFSEEIPEVILDEHMDLLRALEMSRLQYLRDAGLLHEPDGQK